MAENPIKNFQDDEDDNNDMEENNENAAGANKPGEFNAPNDTDSPPSKPSVKINMVNFKWHWVAVFAVAVIVIYLSLLNGVSLETALIRALYSTAIFWVIAEVVDWVIHKTK
jgi:hypothetical protein